jgi:hypothetical protein
MLFIARDYRLNTTVKGGMWCYRCRAGRQEGGTPGDAGNTARPEPDPWKRTFARVGNCAPYAKSNWSAVLSATRTDSRPVAV